LIIQDGRGSKYYKMSVTSNFCPQKTIIGFNAYAAKS
jgi:hypothetical protein